HALLNAARLLISRSARGAHIPVKGFTQAIMLIASIIVGVFILAQLMGKSPVYFLSGIGALTAIIILIFKDAILGFVAGIQISVNQMVRVGDWIEMPKNGADGFVIDVSLTTVKVSNWDKTITTIPTYSLISDSFKNWRGMFESGGRRIKRSLLIDMQTAGFATEEQLAHWKKFRLLRPYLDGKLAEIADENSQRGEDLGVLGNGRRLTNIGTFRAYCIAYLKAHPGIHQDMTFLVRQLQPTENGVPIEIYVFTKDTRWAFHEGVQADIFDHLLAVIDQFGLRVFQTPSGYDIGGAVKLLRDKPHAGPPA
ncbi:MAG: mechanosensitive ion channel domain-containing protein, partial [Rariglobus sp.]